VLSASATPEGRKALDARIGLYRKMLLR
jgi:hypothetical protein